MTTTAPLCVQCEIPMAPSKSLGAALPCVLCFSPVWCLCFGPWDNIVAVALLNEEDRELLKRGCLAELLYADDTLLLSVNPASLERFLVAISETGAKYGLQLHMGKFQLLQVRATDIVCRLDGSGIDSKSEIAYLGCTVSEDGRISGELARRLGIAGKEFKELQRVWKHSSLGRARKLHIFKALVVSKLMYSLSTIWLNTSERRRLNGFQNRCLRQIWGIAPAFLSRVSNFRVLQTTGQEMLASDLARQQLLLFGKAARAEDASMLRGSVFCPGSLRSACDRYVRKVGRPRLEWATEVHKLAVEAASGIAKLDMCLASVQGWKKCVAAFRH